MYAVGGSVWGMDAENADFFAAPAPLIRVILPFSKNPIGSAENFSPAPRSYSLFRVNYCAPADIRPLPRTFAYNCPFSLRLIAPHIRSADIYYTGFSVR